MPFRRQPSPSGKASRDETTETLIRSRVPVDLLRLGMRVVKLDRPWTEVPVLFQGFTIDTVHQLSLLRHYCNWVLVESTATMLAPVLAQIEQVRKQRELPLPETRPLNEELPRARQIYESGQHFVAQMLDDIKRGRDLDLDQAKPIIQSCVESISANANAMFWMNRIKHQDAYTAEHCLRVAILAIAFARYLGMPGTEMETAGLCGLLHDIGKMSVPAHILNKPGPLTADEMREMQRHTELGHQMLRAHHTLDPIVANVCRDHHERPDGRGYPRGLEEWQISRFTRLISIVDVFDAVTSDRCYREGLPTTEAMRILYAGRGRQFEPAMIEAFIRMVGVYPPGSLIGLNSGEVGVVVGTHPSYKLRPRVEILLDANKNPVTPRVIDLKDNPVTGSGDVYAITTPLSDGAYGITLTGRIHDLTG